MAAVTSAPRPQIGPLLRDWRQRRRLSQLELALDAGVSTRHLSFVETGRARPSPEMLLLLAEQLQVPLRERNRLLLAAGYAPQYSERSIGEPEMLPVQEAVQLVLTGHDPYPAIAINKSWNLVAHNRGAAMLLAGLPAHLLEPPVNVLRASLHPEGLAPRILNYWQWRSHLLDRLGRQARLTGDVGIELLHKELTAYPAPPKKPEPPDPVAINEVVVPLRIAVGDAQLTLLSTVTTFGTPIDITVAELSMESFFPADGSTADLLRELASSP